MEASAKSGAGGGPEKPPSRLCAAGVLRRAGRAILIGLALAAPLGAGASDLPAFPGAAGFGAAAVGGRDGVVIRVTSRADDGPGTLRAALERTGPRIVVFEVAGEIALTREITMAGRVTVAGQTAPAPGVTITGARLQVAGDDVIIRGLRLRPGAGPGQPLGERDGVSIGAKDHPVRRVILDGNSISWAPDENVSVWYESEDVTISGNIIAEALNEAGHPKGAHSMGLLVGPKARRVSILRNLFVSNRWRNPQFRAADRAEVVNNLMVNYGPGGLSVNESPMTIDVINNVFEAGPDTPRPERRPAIHLLAPGPADRAFVAGNLTPMGPDVMKREGDHGLAEAALIPRAEADVLPAASVRAHVLATAGARAPGLDPVDARLLSEAAGGAGRIVDAPPVTAPASFGPEAARGPDTDGDGLPDAAERALGSDPGAVDSHLRSVPGGYAFIELYANSLLEP